MKGHVLSPALSNDEQKAPDMFIYYLITVGGLVLLTGSALLAFHWVLRTGQLKNPARIALQIFDEEEPVGEMTDWFPGRKPPASVSGSRKADS